LVQSFGFDAFFDDKLVQCFLPYRMGSTMLLRAMALRPVRRLRCAYACGRYRNDKRCKNCRPRMSLHTSAHTGAAIRSPWQFFFAELSFFLIATGFFEPRV